MTGTNRMERGSYGELREILERYPVGSVVVGRRDPSDGKVRVALPEQQASKLGLVLAVAIPLLFVATGVRGVWAAIRGLPEDGGRDGGSSEGRFGWLIGMAFGGLFFAIGGVACVYLLVLPVVKVGKAKAWKETPCVIEHSRVTSSRGSKGGTTYQAEVLYRYEFEGMVHRSDCLTFSAVGVQGQTRSRDYVERMAPGFETKCFVDPADSKRAVLDRTDSGVFSSVLIVLLFPVAGAGIMIFSWKQRPVRQRTWRPLRRGASGGASPHEPLGSPQFAVSSFQNSGASPGIPFTLPSCAVLPLGSLYDPCFRWPCWAGPCR